MKTHTDGLQEFNVCDFCDQDESGNVGNVHPIGNKGICDLCLGTLAALLEALEV